MEYYCKTCGDCVTENGIRSHAELHTPQATGMEWEDLLTNYETLTSYETGSDYV